MSKSKFACTFMVVLVLFFISCQKEKNEVAIGNIDCTTVTYSGTIAPLFASHCNTSGCHDAGSSDGDFTSYSKLKPYLNDGSVRSEVITKQSMPEDGPLNSEQLAQVQCWLDDGGINN